MKPKVTRYADAATVDSPIDTFLNCMEEVVPLYETAGNGNSIVRYFSGDPNQRGRVIAGDLLGYFVFAKGGFRFIPEEILMMLPSARPVRLKLDLNVMRSKLLNGSQTKFPEEAFRRRIFGEVVIHLIFDVGGNIKELKVMEGDPILSKWAIDEVRQWRFAPTLLDGDPVEVELEVTKSFTRQ